MINFIEINYLISEKLTSLGRLGYCKIVYCKILKAQVTILVTKIIIKCKKILSVFPNFLLLLKYSALKTFFRRILIQRKIKYIHVSSVFLKRLNTNYNS